MYVCVCGVGGCVRKGVYMYYYFRTRFEIRIPNDVLLLEIQDYELHTYYLNS